MKTAPNNPEALAATSAGQLAERPGEPSFSRALSGFQSALVERPELAVKYAAHPAFDTVNAVMLSPLAEPSTRLASAEIIARIMPDFALCSLFSFLGDANSGAFALKALSKFTRQNAPHEPLIRHDEVASMIKETLQDNVRELRSASHTDRPRIEIRLKNQASFMAERRSEGTRKFLNDLLEVKSMRVALHAVDLLARMGADAALSLPSIGEFKLRLMRLPASPQTQRAVRYVESAMEEIETKSFRREQED